MIGKILINIRTLGLGATLLYALERLARHLGDAVTVRSYRLMAQPVRDRPRLPERRRKGFEARPLEAGDAAFGQLPLETATLERRFAQGARCLGLFRGERLVAALWHQFGDYEEDEVRCRFRLSDATAAAWDFDVYVQPDQRAGFAFAALWDAADATLRESGRRFSLSRISAFNPASLGSHQRLGAREVGRATFIGLGPVQLCHSTLLRPRLHLALRRRERPVITIPVPSA